MSATRSSRPTATPAAATPRTASTSTRSYLEDFDAWRGKYKNPYKDLGDNRRLRNWDNEMRNSPAGGRRHRRRGHLPEHGPAVLPELRAVRQAADAARSTSTAWPASTPTTAGWSTWCGEFPERRAGIGQIFLNDIDDAIEDVRWIKEHGLRGGILLPNIPPDVKWVKPLYDPELRPAVGRCARTSRSRSTCTAAPAHPDYGAVPRRRCCSTSPRSASTPSARFVQLHAVGRVRALPAAEVRDDRDRAAPGCRRCSTQLDQVIRRHPRQRRHRRDPLQRRTTSCRRTRPSTSTRTVDGCEPARAGRRRGPRRRSASTGSCGAATTPTTRARTRTRASTCGRASTTYPRPRSRKILAGNAAKLYDFDLDALAPLAAKIGPTVAEIADADRRGAGEDLERTVRRHGLRRPSSERPRVAESNSPVASRHVRPPGHAQPSREAQRAQPPAAWRAHRTPCRPRTWTPTSASRSCAAPDCFSAGYDLGGGNEGLEMPHFTAGRRRTVAAPRHRRMDEHLGPGQAGDRPGARLLPGRRQRARHRLRPRVRRRRRQDRAIPRCGSACPTCSSTPGSSACAPRWR